MARDVLGMSTKRVVILLAVMAAVMFSASGLSPGEPDAQTASTNGKIAYVGFNVETEKQDIYTINPDGTGVTNLTRRLRAGNPDWGRHPQVAQIPVRSRALRQRRPLQAPRVPM